MSESTNEKSTKPPVFYDRHDAARLVGISVETIRTWIKKEVFIPKYRTPLGESGKRFSYVFSEADIKEMKALKLSRKVGRPVGSRNVIDTDKIESI